MDPIKVDFFRKGGSKNTIVVPPEKAALKIVLSIVCTVAFAAILFYFIMPAINIKAYEFYLYLGLTAIAYIIFSALFTRAITKPEYMPYVKKQARVPAVIIAILVLVVAIGFLVSCQFFRAQSYSQIISVESYKADKFNEVVEEMGSSGAEGEVNLENLPKLDDVAANELASRALGELENKGYVSQFKTSETSYQVNFDKDPVRVVPLEYADLIKWFYNTKEGLPGYVIVNVAGEDTTFVETPEKIRYSPSEHFGRLLKRHLRFEYPTYMFGEANFDIDDNKKPYWVCPVLDKTIGLFGGTDVIGVVLVDAYTGECTELSLKDIKESGKYNWIDRIYSSDLLVEQFNFYGKYGEGFWNSILGQKGVVATTEGHSYIAKSDDVWLYTGVTSVTSDNSIVGFVLVNQRTKETQYYRVSGGTESAAQSAAEGRVKDLGYTATFPLLVNIGGKPTYFMSLKDGKNIVQQYAFINVENYNKIGATGDDIYECLDKYISALEDETGEEINVDIDNIDDVVDEPAKETVTVMGAVEEIRTAVMGGESYYYIKVASVYYVIPASKDEKVVILNVGDTVTVSYVQGEGNIIAAESITIN